MGRALFNVEQATASVIYKEQKHLLNYIYSFKYRMGFFLRYITFVAAFLSASKLTESIEIRFTDVTDSAAVKAFAERASKADCVPFHPLMKDPIDASALDPRELQLLFAAHVQGDFIEICSKKGAVSNRRRTSFLGDTAVELIGSAIEGVAGSVVDGVFSLFG